MASYPFIYNGVDLTNLARVRTVQNTVLPPRENHSIMIWERMGSIYNSYRYGERTITVTFLIRASQSEFYNNQYCMDNKLNTIRNVFNVTEPKALYLGSRSKYIYAVPEGESTMTEIRYDCYECTIQFICHDPQYYSASVSTSNNRVSSSTYGMRNIISYKNTIDVYNSGNSIAYPIINIGVNSASSFVQVDNISNGNKFLLGSYPKAGITTLSPITNVLSDNMMTPSIWTVGSPYALDANKGYSGSLGTTSDGSGLKIDSVSTGSLWSGVSAHRKLSSQLDNFEVRAKLHLNSHGIEGDPTLPQLKDEGTIYSGSREYYYKVTAPSVPIRSTPEPFGNVVSSYNKGDSVFPTGPIANGWLQVEEGYCEAVYLKKYIYDDTETDMAINVVTNKEIELRSLPNDNIESILLATIPSSKPLRVCNAMEYGYYKLYIPYEGKIGYIDSSKVTIYPEVVDYPEEEIIETDDYKTGICEVYGFSADGKKLFKLCLSDENVYYSFVTPTVHVGDNKVLEDTTTIHNSSKGYIDEYNVSFDYLSDTVCDWNNFYGELGISRINNSWQAWIYKIENGVPVKKLVLKEHEISGAPTESLDHIVIYMGTQDPSNMCGMAITDIQVDNIAAEDTLTNYNLGRFKKGDEIKIDCYNAKVYLNNKLYNDIDINSRFIELITGNNTLKFTSEDSNLFATVLFNERYL